MKNHEKGAIKDFYENEYYRGDRIVDIPLDDDFVYGQVIQNINQYIEPGLKVLDLGCNNGNISLFMAQKGCQVTGIDLASSAIKMAKENAKYHNISNVDFIAMDFLSEWDSPNTFDFILCSHVIEHVPNDEMFLEKIVNALKSNGKLLILTPTYYSSMYLSNKVIYGKFKFDEDTGHLRRYTKKSFSTLISKSGLNIRKLTFLDSILREWVIISSRFHFLHRILGRRYIRSIFNRFDQFLAQVFFPATICIYAQKDCSENEGDQQCQKRN